MSSPISLSMIDVNINFSTNRFDINYESENIEYSIFAIPLPIFAPFNKTLSICFKDANSNFGDCPFASFF
jgi:hypothetical protein